MTMAKHANRFEQYAVSIRHPWWATHGAYILHGPTKEDAEVAMMKCVDHALENSPRPFDFLVEHVPIAGSAVYAGAWQWYAPANPVEQDGIPHALRTKECSCTIVSPFEYDVEREMLNLAAEQRRTGATEAHWDVGKLLGLYISWRHLAGRDVGDAR